MRSLLRVGAKAATPAPVRARSLRAGWQRRLEHWAWLAIPAVAAVSAILFAADLRQVHEAPALLLILNAVFSTSVFVFIAILAGRSYLSGGGLPALSLGCGGLIFALAAAIAPVMIWRGHHNAGLQVHNLGMCLSGFCHLFSAICILLPAEAIRRVPIRRHHLPFFYTLALAAMAGLSIAVRRGVFPPFSVLGDPHTAARNATLGAGVTAFALSAVLFGLNWRARRTHFTFWYFLGLALMAVGLLTVWLAPDVGTALSWMGRCTQYLAGLYMLNAGIHAVRATGGWQLPLRRALRETEHRYRMLVQHSPDAILVESDRIVLFANAAAVRLWGAESEESLLGRNVLDLLHADDRVLVNADATHVLREGNSPAPAELRVVRLDGQVVPIEAAASRVQLKGRDAVQVVIRDITERKAAEHIRQEGEQATERGLRRFELLAQTAGQLLQSAQPQMLMESLCRKVMEHLDCQVFFNYLLDGPSGRLHMNAYAGVRPEDAGRFEWIDAGAATSGLVAQRGSLIAERIGPEVDERTELVRGYGIRTYACYPLLGPAGKIVGTLSFGTRSRESFSPEDLSLMKAVADQVTTAILRTRDEQALRQAAEELEMRVAQRTGELAQANAALEEQVAQRAEVQAQLQAQRQRLHDVLDLLPAYVSLMAPDRRVRFANRFWRERFGEPAGRHCYECMPEAQGPCPECQTYSVLDTGKSNRWGWTAPDRRRYDVFDFPFTDADGSRLIMKVGIDVTEREQAEASLRQAGAYHRSLLEASPDPMVAIGPDGRITDVNAATEKISGRGRAELIGADFSSFFTDSEQVKAGYLEAFKEGLVRDWPLEIRHRAGGTTPVLFNAAVYRDQAGNVCGLFAAARDITERRAAEAIIRRQAEQHARQAEQHATMLATTPDGFWVADDEGRLQDVNDAYCRMSGYSRKELLEMRIVNLEAAESPEEVAAHIRKIKECGFDRFETRHRRKDGGTVNVEISISYWRQADRFLLFARNITERKLAQAELDRLVDDLQDEVQMRIDTQQQLAASNLELHERADQLARLASELTLAEQRERHRLAQVLHDHLQQLLVGATFGIEVLSRRLEDETQRANLENIRKLLEESIATSRSLTVELSPPILHEGGLAAGLEWLARWMEEKHALCVEFEGAPAAVAEREDVRVLLFAAVRELLLNVVKHARVTRAKVTLDVDAQDNLQIQVCDQGVGFDRQGASAAQTAGGFGLFSIRERLGLLGGRMVIDSSPQCGTRVMLVAPRRNPKDSAGAAGTYEPAMRPARRPPAPAQTKPAPRALRVLLVDDHVVMRQGLSLLLKEEAGIAVVGEASDGEEALDLARALRPDVILMDYSMPNMNGLEATRAIYAELPEIRIIALSMYSEADQAAAMMAAGAVAYLTKSGPPEVLLAAIREAAVTEEK